MPIDTLGVSEGYVVPEHLRSMLYYPGDGAMVHRGRKAIQQLVARDHRCTHFVVRVQLLKLKFIPPWEEVTSTPYCTLPTFISPK